MPISAILTNVLFRMLAKQSFSVAQICIYFQTLKTFDSKT